MKHLTKGNSYHGEDKTENIYYLSLKRASLSGLCIQRICLAWKDDSGLERVLAAFYKGLGLGLSTLYWLTTSFNLVPGAQHI